MLYRDFNSQEGYIHICDDSYKYVKEYVKERVKALPIYVHDCSVYTLIEKSDGKGYKGINVTYCPHCGADVESEERSSEIYDIEKGKFYDWRTEKYYDKKGVTK